jgi:putative FmdB family regulatory protein
MPIYEYVCGSCKKKTEVIQRVNEAKLKVCPHCGGRLTKAFSAPAIQFKGSGFYITDYARARQEDGARGSGEKSEGGGSEKSEKAGKAEKVEKTETTEKKKGKKATE